jgi:hypothetical protein
MRLRYVAFLVPLTVANLIGCVISASALTTDALCFPEICVGRPLAEPGLSWQTAPQRRYDATSPTEAAIAADATRLFPGLSDEGGHLIGRYRFVVDGVTFPHFAQVGTVCRFTVVSGKLATTNQTVTTAIFGPTEATPRGGGLRAVALRRLYPFAAGSASGKAVLAELAAAHPGDLAAGVAQETDAETGSLAIVLFDPAAFFYINDDKPGRNVLDTKLRSQPDCR